MTKARPKTARPKTHNLVYLHRDRGYRFGERDPQLEHLCQLIYASEMSTRDISQSVSKSTGGAYTVSESTMTNWLNGKTKRPQNFTMTWVAFALGYERRWVKLG